MASHHVILIVQTKSFPDTKLKQQKIIFITQSL